MNLGPKDIITRAVEKEQVEGFAGHEREFTLSGVGAKAYECLAAYAETARTLWELWHQDHVTEPVKIEGERSVEEIIEIQTPIFARWREKGFRQPMELPRLFDAGHAKIFMGDQFNLQIRHEPAKNEVAVKTNAFCWEALKTALTSREIPAPWRE